MQETGDIDLLQQYAREGSEAAFAALVARHVNLVFSASLRKTGNPHAAEEITQAVFIILAKKAHQLRRGTILSGWLYQAARLTAASFLRGEIRRTHREQEAYMQSLSNETESDTWPEIMPFLEDAMGVLGEKDRQAIVLRFFEGKSFQEVGAAFNASENAAKKRVAYALEKLHRYFSRRGVSSTTAIIAGAISANSVQTAPAALAGSVTAAALAKGAAASGSTLTLIKGALKIMAWTKMKMTAVSSLVVLLAAGTTTITVLEIHNRSSWRFDGFDSGVLDRQPPQVHIFPSKLQGNSHGWGNNGRMAGTGVSASTLVSAAYGFPTTARTRLATDLPQVRYDYIASLTNGSAEALQQEVKRELGVIAKIEMLETNVMLLKVKTANAPGLKPTPSPAEDSYETWNPHHYESRSKYLGHFACVLEQYANVPVVDQTGFTNTFDMNLDWPADDLKNQNWDNMNQALAPLGLELLPGRESIAMLVVEKAN